MGEFVLGKTPKGFFSRYLELDCGPKVIPEWLFFIFVKMMTISFVI